MVTDVTSTTITVQWGPVEPCADQNGVITGYAVRYVETESGNTHPNSTTERQLTHPLTTQ